MFWEQQIETMPPADLRTLQLQRLQATLQRAVTSPYYQLTVPAGADNSKRQIKFMKDFGTTIIHVIPSYALHLLSVFEEVGIDPKRDLHLKIAYLGAEPYFEHTRIRLEEGLGAKVFNSFGLSEMSGPGVAFECPDQGAIR